MNSLEERPHDSASRLRSGLGAVLPGLVLIVVGLAVFLLSQPFNRSKIEVEEKSEFSHIRIRRRGNFREMLFVRDNGREARQSGFNLDVPHELTSPYSQVMFASYLFKPQQARVLIVGLGGGSMVRFLKHHEPDLKVDVVEIDPVVVKLAAEYFEARSDDNINIMTTDGFAYLRNTERRYDVIYFDAFLKPSDDTDATGVPQQLKTTVFYKSVQSKLKPSGVVAFNLNVHADTQTDIRTIRDAFPQTTVFSCSGSTNLVVVSTISNAAEELSTLEHRAKQLDSRFPTTFSFETILKNRLAYDEVQR